MLAHSILTKGLSDNLSGIFLFFLTDKELRIRNVK
jgi:hypothetical protein